MPSQKQPAAWQVILEDIRSQNRSTIEALDAWRVALETRMDRAEKRSESRFEALG